MIVRQPSAKEDRPAIASTSIVGALCLGAGLWLARGAMAHPVVVAESESETQFAAPPPSEVEGEGEGEVEVEGEGEGDPEGEVEPEVEPITPAAPAATPRPPPPTGTGSASGVRHGRVAYLRCDGAPQASGPFPCPRDAALEATVWAAIDQLLACTPALPPGQADLVLQFDRAASPELTVTTRDTFPDDAIRTDAAAVVTCLGPSLAATTTTMPGDLIRVGFRFTLD